MRISQKSWQNTNSHNWDLAGRQVDWKRENWSVYMRSGYCTQPVVVRASDGSATLGNFTSLVLYLFRLTFV